MAKMDPEFEKLIPAKEVVEYLHIGRTTLHRLMKERKIGFIKVGKKVFFTKEHLEAFIRKATVSPKK